MNPLFEKYFFGELTDAEEQTLEQTLTQSETEAWEFGQAAEEIYHRYGLPEPQLPGDAEQDGGIKPWKWLIPILLLLLSGTYFLWRSLQSVPEPIQKPITTPAPVPVKKAVQQAMPILKKAVKAVVKPMETPPDAAKDKVSGNNLKVVVHREVAGTVVVRVINSLGLEVRRMYAGTLQAGRWSFEWDGRSGDGQLVEPGKYYIQVQSEGMTQSREVNIR
ncbi:MAG TPA: FlgD immunoglobulin-like domain containing protein [bacterium]|nr:FlgD immunoglobulin-like domain containing protein [bacterium]